MTQESSHNTHNIKPQTISSTLSINKFKKNIKPKTSKYQNKMTKETVPYVSSEPLHPHICLFRSKTSYDLTDPRLYFLIKMSTNPIKHLIFLKQTDILDLSGSKKFHGFAIPVGKMGLIVYTVFSLFINP